MKLLKSSIINSSQLTSTSFTILVDFNSTLYIIKDYISIEDKMFKLRKMLKTYKEFDKSFYKI